MNEIKCPKCGTAFKIDEMSYADIARQIHDHEFDRALQEQTKLLKEDKAKAVQLAEVNTKSALQAEASKKEAEIVELKAKLEFMDSQKDSEMKIALSQIEKERDGLKTRLDSTDTEKRLAVTEAVSKIEKERDRLAAELKGKDSERRLLEVSMEERYKTQLKDRDDTIERLKDMKSRLSVKLVGENLEQHCQNEFNGVRTNMFPFAYFEKDNAAVKDDGESKGTKGDFIYRDYDARGGVEIISIMFEMKDEQDESSNKKTVESHLDKLDKDRKKKGLEYAVLVTLLETDNEFYNRGIVDMSYKYEKMYVVRPQFFLPLISLLKNANLKTAEARSQLMIAQGQNADVTTFENDMNAWKDGWLRTMKNAGKKHVEGVEQINKAIRDLENARDALIMSDKHLLAAENKMDDLTIKRLTRKNPTMAAKFEELKTEGKKDE